MHRLYRHKRALSIFSLVFLAVSTLAISLYPQPARAQWVVSNPDLMGFETSKEVKMSFANTLYASALGALINGASYFMRKLAYDTAKYIASGGKGQGALAFDKGFGSYIEGVALDSAAGAIEQFGKPFGLNLCAPPDIGTQVFIQVGLSSIYDADATGGAGGPSSGCTWGAFTKNWEQGIDSIRGKEADELFLQQFSKSLTVSQTDFGIAMGARAKIDRLVAEKKDGEMLQRLEGSGFKPITDLIAGNIKTPAQVVQSEAETITSKHQGEISTQQISGIYGAGAAQIPMMAASVFLNTLTSELLNKILSGGLFGDSSGDGGNAAVDPFAFLNAKKAQAEKSFSFLVGARPQTDLSNYDLILQFSTCFQNPQTEAGLNNCVIGDDFVKLFQRPRGSKPLSIREALDGTPSEGAFLDKNKPLIPPSSLKNSDLNYCADSAYCYSNIQKLRKARILPLGFEIAALTSDPDKPVTLGKVVDEFDICNDDSQADSAHPYCHLIDPNWILKQYEAKCALETPGPQLLNESVPNRRSECVDVVTCLKEGENGECLSYDGYCTKESNVWRLSGKSCDEQNATCKTFTKVGQDAYTASYLARTVDSKSCNADAAGCRAYSTEKVGDTWVSSVSPVEVEKRRMGRTPIVFFNDNIQNQICLDSGDEGCSAFYEVMSDYEYETTHPISRVRQTPSYIKKAPAYLGCYDKDISDPDIDWPETEADIARMTDRPAECSSNKFAQVCIEEEVGCSKYAPVGSGDTAVGIVGSNYCDARCVGYETFKKQADIFEPAEFPLYFIPDEAQSCPAEYAGCSEFTNIDKANQGGESLEYYSDLKYCERPEGENEKTYYSWEGSDATGYVLKMHKLRPIDDTMYDYISDGSIPFNSGDTMNDVFGPGSPAYADYTNDKLSIRYSVCNQETYNEMLQSGFSIARNDPDCRALYDNEGNIYYRLLSQTITVSNSCHPLRKTEPYFYTDTQVSSGEMCTYVGGQMRSGSCVRCTNNGRYMADGSCVYWTISTPSESHSCQGPANNPGQYNGCRTYVGNRANDVQSNLITSGSFEPTSDSASALTEAKEGWNSGEVRPEAIQVGTYSLRLDNNAPYYTFATSTLYNNYSYELSFWVRGEAQNLEIYIEQNGARVGTFTQNDIGGGVSQRISVSQTWEEYRLGPVRFAGDSSSTVRLVFARSGGSGAYYIDNVRLESANDEYTLIKNSWKKDYEGDGMLRNVPQSCDINPDDAYPGAALGCREYRNELNNPVYFTGFERLCRFEAAGCTALLDTYNTLPKNSGDSDATKAQAFNLKCSLSSASIVQTCSINITTGGQVRTLGQCQVPAFTSSCYVPKVVLPADVSPTDIGSNYISTSTVFVPADTPLDSPIYLTARQEFSCNSQNLGCQKVALQEQIVPDAQVVSSYIFTELFIQNNPSLYTDAPSGQNILCQDQQLGCGAFTSGQNVHYFKDPRLTGNSLCVYRPAVGDSETGETRYGWYMDGVGRCETGGALCRSDGDCATGVCNSGQPVPCYENYLQPGGEYGIWSSNSSNYRGLVGTCPATQSGCAELIDPQDKSDAQHPDGKAYYAIYNDELTGDTEAVCDSKVSLKEGCVLFDKTDEPNKLFNSTRTYASSTNADPAYSLVTPINTPDSNDTNKILRVIRDRECSEWLSCRSSVGVADENGKVTHLCYEYGTCRELDEEGNCVDPILSADEPLSYITKESYTDRGVDWYDEEYTGYSLYRSYAPMHYRSVFFDDERVAYLAAELSFENVIASTANQYGCYNARRTISGNVVQETDGRACGFDYGGRCYHEMCLYPIDKVFPNGSATANAISIPEIRRGLRRSECKAYPEEDSPFYWKDITTEQKDVGRIIGGINYHRYTFSNVNDFANAHICQKVNNTSYVGTDCACEYEKITYRDGAVVDYWPYGIGTNIPLNICVGGDNAGKPCAAAADCGIGENGSVAGLCSPIAQRNAYLGQRGFCLEYDLSRNLGDGSHPCLTWLPIRISASRNDVFNVNQEAGYLPDQTHDAPTDNGKVYCIDAMSGSGIEEPEAPFDPLDTVYSLYVNHFCDMVGDTFCPRASRDYFELVEDEGDSTENLQKIYNVIQSLVWTRIGTHTKVLRVEKEVSDSFGAVAFSEEKMAAFGFGVNPPQGAHEYGTLMHPPRFWGNTRTELEYLTPPQNMANGDVNERYLSTVSFGPGPYMLDKYRGSYKGVLRSKAELDMNETDIQSIYFLPLSYPKGAQNLNPHLLDIENPFKLVVNELRLSQERGKVGFANRGHQDDCRGSDCRDVLTGGVNGALVWSFLLERDPAGTGNSNWGSWQYDPTARISDNLNPNDPKNRIARRYVAVFMMGPDSGQTFRTDWPTFAVEAFQNFSTTQPGVGPVPNTENQDPFNFVEQFEGSSQNFIAIGLDFNADGQFLGYISRYAQPSGSDDNGITFAVAAEFNPVCSQYDVVFKDNAGDQSKPTNKAWTNRVWSQAVNTTPISWFKQLALTQTNQPFGSLNISVSEFTADEYVNSDPPNEQKWDLRRYTLAGESYGVPYMCRRYWFDGDVLSGVSDAFDCAYLGKSGYGYGSLLISDLYSSKGGHPQSDAISSLFLKVFERDILNNFSTGEFDIGVGIDLSSDTTRIAGTSHPQIFALNPSTCYAQGIQCTAAEKDNFTVNQRNYNVDETEDKDSNGISDPIIAALTYAANVQFFAYADDNRMPIKQVKVDWHDKEDTSDIANDGTYGMYKNRKPYCDDQDGVKNQDIGYCRFINSNNAMSEETHITCKEDKDCPDPHQTGWRPYCDKVNNAVAFGDSPRACKEGYFEFSHRYDCLPDSDNPTVGDVGGNVGDIFESNEQAREAYRKLTTSWGLDDDSQVCVFKPRVQVVDNWGWCNGRCVKSYTNGVAQGNPSDGCYEGVPNTDDPENKEYQCDSDGISSGVYAWTDYKGAIIVIPRASS